jgi:hypothetical protein
VFRKLFLLAMIGFVLWAYNAQVEAIDSNWVGGKDGIWENPGNWDPAIVPDNDETNTFNVTIAAVITDDDSICIGLTQSHTINHLDCNVTGDDLKLERCTSDWIELRLDEPNGLTNYGELEIKGKEHMIIKGNVTNIAGTILTLDGVEINGNLKNLSTAELEIGNEVGLEGNLENDGLFVIDIDSEFWADPYIKNTGEIQLYGGECGSDGVFDNNSIGAVTGFGTVFGDDLFANQGEVCASGGSLFLYSDGVLTNTSKGTLSADPASTLHVRAAKDIEDINNLGKIEVRTGAVTFGCNLVNEPGGVIKLLGETLAAPNITQKTGATFEGFGTITCDVEIEPGGLIELTGPTNIVGDVNVPADATLRISDGQTLITGHTTCEGTIHLVGGTVIFQGGCDCNECDIINEAGIDRNHFDVNADGAVNLEDYAYFVASWLWESSWY